MIRHIVLFRAKPEVPGEALDKALSALSALRDLIPGILEIAHGANVSPEGMDRGYTHAFTIDFTNAKARDAYLADPRHRVVGAALVELSVNGIAGICVFDFGPSPS